ncbi:MAG: hypothetical protein AB7I59_28815 [Geminicoccaceae bacterium]
MLPRAIVVAATLLACASCASRPPGAPPMSADATNGQAIAAALGTPFHALFKATACVVSTVIVVPTAAALALTNRPEREEEMAASYAGLGRNCYGSYALEPI